MFRQEIEQPTSLFQRPMYRGSDAQWHTDFLIASEGEDELDWDLATLLSTLSFGYAFGNKTLFKQISRRPWLSEISTDGTVSEQTIPKHGRRWMSPKHAAAEMLRRLEEELEHTCAKFDSIYVLLSGGLDSRIVAGVLRRLLDAGRLEANVVALTWGMNESRDVALAKETAQQLNFTWEHFELAEEHLEENLHHCVDRLGATVSPIHLHRMPAVCELIPQDALVLAGSYGDSVGRSEYSRRTVLELQPMRPYNFQGLMSTSWTDRATSELNDEILSLHERAGQQPEYVHCEHQQQCHYMRGVIAQTMSVINDRATVYQAFTSESVFGFSWSLHPAARTDKIYAELMHQIGYSIGSIPWARNNVSPDQKRRDRNLLSANYHDYPQWTRDYVERQIDQVGLNEYLSSFERLQFLDPEKLRIFVSRIRDPDTQFSALGHQPHTVIMWLESLKQVVQRMPDRINRLPAAAPKTTSPAPVRSRSRVRQLLSSVSWMRKLTLKLRSMILRRLSLWKYPVEPVDHG